MPEIPSVGVGRVWVQSPALSIPKAPPVTVDIGVPVISMPSFKASDYNENATPVEPVVPKLTLPKARSRTGSKATDSSESSSETPTGPAKLPLDFTNTKSPTDQDVRCPPLRAKEVGTLVQGGEKRISGYEIQEGKCIVLYEEIPLSEQVIAAIPSLPQVTTVGITAAVGVTAGVATPFLLKLIKPAMKTAVKKAQKALGRPTKPISVFERRQAQRRLRK